YILGHLATSQITLAQLVNRLTLRGLQGFLPSVQQVSISPEPALKVQARLTAGSLPRSGRAADEQCLGYFFLEVPPASRNTVGGGWKQISADSPIGHNPTAARGYRD